MLIDFHSHILPAMDDGCADIGQTKAVLADSQRQGVAKMVATPHFYPTQEDPASFLHRRENAVDRLRTAAKEAGFCSPKLYVGAEVAYYQGIGRSDEMAKLCLYGTRTILVEMPFEKWPDRVIADLCDVQNKKRLTVVVAHINRYLQMQPRGIAEALKDLGFFLQWNAEAFTSFKTRHAALKALKHGLVDVIGSDAHDPQRRPQELGACVEIIKKHEGPDALLYISRQTESLMDGAGLLYEHDE